ncbi:MAG TPA: acyl-CoA dehydrogenase family protein [Gemmatimonadaceae bacterium]|nr:acyl-CoA dehydrogenase family protein [Gemmatimonadaceae bacterium]
MTAITDAAPRTAVPDGRTASQEGNRSVLSDELLGRCQERAPGYDRDNRFFEEDFAELRDAGYLTIAVPRELGGRGFTLAEVCREQRRLGYHAPATALGINMHLYWTGLVADLWRSGDKSLEWLLREAANGAVFAAGHAESGNDIPVLLSTSRADRTDGGYRFTGRKAFGSLSPAWTYLGLHALDTSDPKTPRVVHAFMPRDTPGYSIKETWDVLGMRATQSDDTVLEDVFVPDKYIARVVPAGAAGVDGFVLGIFAWALLGFGNIYYGMARRALDLTLQTVKSKGSLGLSRSMAYHAGVQHGVAEMVLDLEAIGPHLDSVAQDWSDGVDHRVGWIIKIVAAKYHAVEGAWRVIDQALDLAGGFGIFRKGPLEQLFRDARLGRIHPANSMLTHELCAKLTLGISPDEQPRWG